MFSLILFSLYTNNLLKYKNRVIKKTCIERRFEFIKKNSVYNEKSGPAQN